MFDVWETCLSYFFFAKTFPLLCVSYFNEKALFVIISPKPCIVYYIFLNQSKIISGFFIRNFRIRIFLIRNFRIRIFRIRNFRIRNLRIRNFLIRNFLIRNLVIGNFLIRNFLTRNFLIRNFLNNKFYNSSWNWIIITIDRNFFWA